MEISLTGILRNIGWVMVFIAGAFLFVTAMALLSGFLWNNDGPTTHCVGNYYNNYCYDERE